MGVQETTAVFATEATQSSRVEVHCTIAGYAFNLGLDFSPREQRHASTVASDHCQLSEEPTA